MVIGSHGAERDSRARLQSTASGLPSEDFELPSAEVRGERHAGRRRLRSSRVFSRPLSGLAEA